jgi:hypothetical protein
MYISRLVAFDVYIDSLNLFNNLILYQIIN